MKLLYFALGVLEEKLDLSGKLEPFHRQLAQQAQAMGERVASGTEMLDVGDGGEPHPTDPAAHGMANSGAASSGAASSGTASSGGAANLAHGEAGSGELTEVDHANAAVIAEMIAAAKLIQALKKDGGKQKPQAVLLLAHGTPDVLGEMDAYLKLVTGGRGVPPHVVKELQERYAEIGLREEPTAEGPHLTRWTMLQGRMLAERLGIPVYVGMRNWKPFIADVVAQMKSAGVTEAKAICLAPQNSRTSVGLYRRALEDAAGDGLKTEFLAGWAEHPLLVRAFAAKMRTALDAAIATGAKTAALFTAHSVPCRTIQASAKPVEHHGMVLATEPDTYAVECKATAKRIAAELGEGGVFANGAPLREKDWYFCFQSQGLSGGPWIGPSVEDTLAALKREGYEHVVLQPVGFLCDHVEILYDIDIAFQKTAAELGIAISRAESLNDSPTLIDALEDLALHGYEAPATAPITGSAEVVTMLAAAEETAAV